MLTFLRLNDAIILKERCAKPFLNQMLFLSERKVRLIEGSMSAA